MDRGNSKHGPRLDDEMAHETRGVVQGSGPVGSRAEEWREPEPSAEDQPDGTLVPELTAGHDGGAPGGMTPDQREARSRLGRYLNRSVFPADRSALTAVAREAQAPEDILDALSRLAPDRTYETVSDVWAGLGGGPERQRF